MLKYDEQSINKMGSLLKTLSDKTRLRIIAFLREGEKNVGEITDKLSMTQSAISHQLKVLKLENIVKSRRDGKNIFYELSDSHIYEILDQTYEHINEKRD